MEPLKRGQDRMLTILYIHLILFIYPTSTQRPALHFSQIIIVRFNYQTKVVIRIFFWPKQTAAVRTAAVCVAQRYRGFSMSMA